MESTQQPHHEASSEATGLKNLGITPSSRNRYDHLRQIEIKMQEIQLSTHEAEAQAKEGYETISWDEKNNGKYMVTFPYPYMNGYLHLGKFSISIN